MYSGNTAHNATAKLIIILQFNIRGEFRRFFVAHLVNNMKKPHQPQRRISNAIIAIFLCIIFHLIIFIVETFV